MRYQYAPVLAVVVLLQHARTPRTLITVAAAGITVVALVLGGLDAATLGMPFQSVWLNYYRNATQGVSGAIGTQPWFFYGYYYCVAWGMVATTLLAFAAFGAVRIPVLAAVVLGTIGLHSLTPHKELRFVFLASACMPMLVGLGLGFVFQRVPRLRSVRAGAPVAAVLAVAVSAYTAASTYGNATPRDAWHRGRSMLQATAAARTYTGACGLALRPGWVYLTGGYTYWHRALPIYFEAWDAAQRLEHSTFRMRLESVIDGRSVPQYAGAAALGAHAGKFNVMVGRPGDILPDFSERSCYGLGSDDDPAYCVFIRPGGCE
jgi:hypothetical protein